MRTFVVIVLVIVLLIGATAVYLAVTTPREPVPLTFPISAGQRALLAHVPATAEGFALVRSAAAIHGRLRANKVTSNAMAEWSQDHEMPAPWMLGGADVVAWKTDRKTAFAIRLDGVRALFVRGWLLFASSADARWVGSTLLMHAEPVAQPSTDVDSILLLTAGLPPANAIVVQREGGRGAYPPMPRPSISSIALDRDTITIISRARSETPSAGSVPLQARFPSGAMLAASFTEPPRILNDLNRLVGMRLGPLLDGGGSVVIYGVDSGTFLPRPNGLLTFPATDAVRMQLDELRRIVSLVGEMRDTGSEIVVSFDRSSMARYLGATFETAKWPANQWALRIDPRRLVPVLRDAGDSAGLKLVASRTARAARDLRRWIDALEQASSIEAAASASGGIDELRVEIAAK